jgi:DNA-damage-inducible protein J
MVLNMTSQMIHARIDSDLKDQTNAILSAIGLTAAEAIRMFFSQIVLNHGLPFEVKIPNSETIRAIEDAEHGRTRKVSLSELKEMLK